MQKLTLKELNEVECKEQLHVEISYRFPALEDFDAEMEINSKPDNSTTIEVRASKRVLYCIVFILVQEIQRI
jgi:hypothetical protein